MQVPAVSDTMLVQSVGALAQGLGIRRGLASLLVALCATGCLLVSIIAVPGQEGLLGTALGVLMLAIAIIDWWRFIIPERLNAIAFALALLESAS